MQFDKYDGLLEGHSYIETKLALIASLSFLGVSYGAILLLWFFMFSDTVLGMAKAATLEGWAGVNRTKFLAGIGTKVAVLFLPLSLALTGALAGYDLNIFVHTALYALIANDAVSCYTNLLSIKTRKHHVNKDLVEMLINAIRATIYDTAKKAIQKISNEEQDDEDKFKKDPEAPI